MLSENVILCPEDDGSWKVNSFRDLYIDEVFHPETMIMKVETDIAGNEIKRVLDENLASYFLEEEFEDAVIEFYKRLSDESIN